MMSAHLTRFATRSRRRPLGAGGSKSMQDNDAPGGTRIPNLLIRSHFSTGYEGVGSGFQPVNSAATPRIADNSGQGKGSNSPVSSHGQTDVPSYRCPSASWAAISDGWGYSAGSDRCPRIRDGKVCGVKLLPKGDCPVCDGKCPWEPAA